MWWGPGGHNIITEFLPYGCPLVLGIVDRGLSGYVAIKHDKHEGDGRRRTAWGHQLSLGLG